MSCGRLGLALLACLLLMPPSVRAVPEKPEGEQKAGQASHGGHGDEAAHEPNIFEPALDLALWTIVVFLILFFVLARYAWKPMLSGLQQREHNILAAQEDARRQREEAERIRDELQKKMDNAAAEVRELFDKARRDAQAATDEMTGKARAEIQAERDRLRREIDMARDQAVQELWNQSAQLATLISAKAIRRQLSPDDHRRLVDEALAELGKAGRQRRESTV